MSDSQMQTIVRDLCYKYIDLWWSCGSDLPDLGAAYPRKDKLIREARLKTSIDNILSELENYSHSQEERQQFEGRLFFLFSNLAKTVFLVEDRHIASVLTTGIVDATREFMHQARQFDPTISLPSIYQASRNAWTMNLFQIFFGLPVRVTPSVLAYSLLYPYTDNYLDDPHITVGAKQAFNLCFRQRLEGAQVTPANSVEEKIFNLVGLIEGQYERNQYPEIYDSLLAIYWAQTKSINLLNAKASPYELDILGLTFEKGGTSVLADAYLAAGNLTPIQRELAFHYGSFTQLMDDLEDIKEDQAAGLMTLFSQTSKHWPLDTVTNRVFHYGFTMLEKIDEINPAGFEPLLELLHMAITPLLIDSISQAGKYYSRAYLQKLEAFYPFRFLYIKKQRKRINKRIKNNRFLLEKLI